MVVKLLTLIDGTKIPEPTFNRIVGSLKTLRPATLEYLRDILSSGQIPIWVRFFASHTVTGI